MTIADSYRKGGFKYLPSPATNFFKRPDVAARVAEIVAEKVAAEGKARQFGIQRAGLTEEWVILRLKHVIDLAIRGVPIRGRDGKETGQFKPDLPSALNGLRTAADIKGMRIHRHEVGAPGEFARMTDDELDTALVSQALAMGLSGRAVNEIIGLRRVNTSH